MKFVFTYNYIRKVSLWNISREMDTSPLILVFVDECKLEIQRLEKQYNKYVSQLFTVKEFFLIHVAAYINEDLHFTI